MSDYLHGIYVTHESADTPVSTTSEGNVQCVIGTAPVHLLANPAAAVNVPLLINSMDDVNSKLGYSDDVDKFTLMQAVHCTLVLFHTAPIICINVLDPNKHTAAKTFSGSLASGVLTLSDEGVLLGSLALTSEDGSTTYASGTDYTTAYNDDGLAVITMVTGGKLTATSAVKATYNILDPSKVTDADIIAGIAAVERVFPLLQYIPEPLLAPGWSQNADVSAALIAESRDICGVFKATALCDIDSDAAETITAAITAKTTNGLNVRDCVPCYPKVTTAKGVTVWLSALAAAVMQYTDAQYNGSPFVSPSNKDAKIAATVLADGTQVMYTLKEANQLNGEGIMTALNFMGWRLWGDNTGIYSKTEEDSGTVFAIDDRYISVKRGFDWQANGFITRYFASKIDNPANYKAIQSFITDENQFYNAFVAAGLVAGMEMVYNQTDNPVSQIAGGTLKTKQRIAPYSPLEVVENTTQYDISLLQSALNGGSNS